MKRFALIALLALLSGPAAAGTFELSDPADELREFQQEKEEELASLRRERNAKCAIDAEEGSCSCFDPESGERVELSSDLCTVRAKSSEAEPQP